MFMMIKSVIHNLLKACKSYSEGVWISFFGQKWLRVSWAQIPAGEQSGLWDGSVLCSPHCQAEEQERSTETAAGLG